VDFRRRAAERRSRTNLTVTERLLRFLQSPAQLEEIKASPCPRDEAPGVTGCRIERPCSVVNDHVDTTSISLSFSPPLTTLFVALSQSLKAMRPKQPLSLSLSPHIASLSLFCLSPSLPLTIPPLFALLYSR
jgi:hypothetical protein